MPPAITPKSKSSAPKRQPEEPIRAREPVALRQTGVSSPQAPQVTDDAHSERSPFAAAQDTALFSFSGIGTSAGLQDILFRRYLVTVRDLVQHLSEEAVRRALEQNTGLESLALGMGEQGVAAAASEGAHNRSECILDLHRARSALLEQAGGAVTAIKAAGLLGKTRQAVEKRRERGTLLAVVAQGEYLYPLFQFENEAVLDGLPEVLQAFTVRNGWTQLSVLLSPQDGLDGRSVVDALKHGDVKVAASVAAAYGDTGG